MAELVLGVDIGGTKIAAGLIAPQTPTGVLDRCVHPTPSVDVISAVTAVIADLIDVAEERGDSISAIGIGAPGVIDPAQGAVLSAGPTMPGWAGTQIASVVRDTFDLPVAVHNDVRVMGLGESVHGAGQGINRVLFVSLGTGIGGALVIDGALWDSPHNTAGELRNLYGPRPDGSADLVENYAAGPGLTAAYVQRSGEEIDLRAIMTRYHDGEALAREVITSNLECFGQALGGFSGAIDVDAIVIGGGVGSIGSPVINAIARGVRSGAVPPSDEVPVFGALLGTDAPIVGAAHLATIAAR